jgi:hypothetical protein
MQPDPRERRSPHRAGSGNSVCLGGQRNVTADPFELVLSRAEGVKRLGNRKAMFRSPNRRDRSPSVSIAVGDDGRVLLHDFGGDSAGEVVTGLGLTLADLFPVRLRPNTPEERRAAMRAAREAQWHAALGVLAFEAAVVRICCEQLRRGEAMNDDDAARLGLAHDRICGAQEVLK